GRRVEGHGDALPPLPRLRLLPPRRRRLPGRATRRRGAHAGRHGLLRRGGRLRRRRAPAPPGIRGIGRRRRRRRGDAGYESQAERRHRETCKKFIALIVFFVEAMLAAITYLAWSLQPNENDAPPPQPTGHDDDDEPSPASIVVCVAATLSGPYLGVWALFVRSILLRGCFVAGDAMCVAAVCVGMSWLFVPVVAGIVLRQINAVLYGHWLYGIAMAGFLGYSLAVNERYQELMLIIEDDFELACL
uniref:Uncharacterized protein n=1 Tax=Oryza glaberrima TaxID=4538 RepID=I1R8F7_ORYGL